ncbi:hypothetical protein ONZ51_g11225 [Trametes cubensis]|uniref:Uncharacterized protein n=1 Tax=Trametes cubensis TaxID=1111947 RepID=A0AAD7TKP0_9APHY|nr:hypothetical protein ONZ51_g11225 [Trametes cubensis]
MAVASLIPSEILEIIFVESQRDPYGVLTSQTPFHPDKATKALAAYSFVCRCWRPVAQELLFRDVVLTLDEQGSRITEFYAFIQSTPYIAGLIQYLLIRSLSAGLKAGRKHDGECPALLVNIIGALPALSHVNFARFTLLGWPKDIPIPSQSIKLAHLSLSQLTYRPLSGTDRVPFDILSLFDVDRLEVSNNHLRHPKKHAHISDVFVRPGSGPPIVRELVYDKYDCFINFNLERGGLDVEHVRLLSFVLDSVESLKFAGLLVNRYGAYATDIHLDLCTIASLERPQSASFWQVCSLAPCIRILRLRLSWIHSYLIYTSDEDYSDAYEAILASTPPTLRELKFSFGSALRGHLGRAAPSVAQRIVQAVSRFQDLKRVTLSIIKPLTVDECAAAINDFLPCKIIERGLVMVESEDD